MKQEKNKENAYMGKIYIYTQVISLLEEGEPDVTMLINHIVRFQIQYMNVHHIGTLVHTFVQMRL